MHAYDGRFHAHTSIHLFVFIYLLLYNQPVGAAAGDFVFIHIRVALCVEIYIHYTCLPTLLRVSIRCRRARVTAYMHLNLVTRVHTAHRHSSGTAQAQLRHAPSIY